MEWHSQKEQPYVPQVICRDINGRVKVCGVKKGEFAPYEWVTAGELLKEVEKLEYVLEQFSMWETDDCPGVDCPYKKQTIKRLIDKEMNGEQIQRLLETRDPDKIECGVKKEDMCYCWAEKYKADFDKSRNH